MGPLGAPLDGRPVGPLGSWAPWAASEPGAPWAPRAPGAPDPLLWVADKFKTLPENLLLGICGSKIGEQKLGFRPRDPHGEIRAGILRRIPVLKSQMVGWRPIWWQKGVTWGPLAFQAQPAHPACGRAVAPTLTPLVSTRPPKFAILLLGGTTSAVVLPWFGVLFSGFALSLIHI